MSDNNKSGDKAGKEAAEMAFIHTNTMIPQMHAMNQSQHTRYSI